MNYYSHHIGDFNNATRHLTRVERSIYRDMLDLYYDTEQPLTLDRPALCRKLLARTEEEATAVEQVLNEFFTKTDQGWYHERCEEVIDEYHKNISDKSAAGKASAAKRMAEKLAKLNSSPTGVEQVLNASGSDEQLTNNHKPITTNQEPVLKNKAPASPLHELVALGVDGQVASDWIKHRKAKRASSAQTVIDDRKVQAEIAGITLEDALRIEVSRGWQGFNAEWLKPGQPRASPAKPQLDLAAAQKAANEEAKRRLFGNDDGRTIDA